MNESFQRRLRRAVVAGALPMAMAVTFAGTSTAAPGQAGVTDGGQAGITTPRPVPAAPDNPDVVHIIPEPPAPSVPDRPVPRPTWVQPVPKSSPVIETEPGTETETNPAEDAPAPPPAGPRLLQVGDVPVPVPDVIDPTLQNDVQQWLDLASTELAIAFDNAGVPANQSDRAALATMGGAYIGATALTAPSALLGCYTGMAVGGVIGAAVGGIPTAGVAGPLGAVIGGGIGCVTGSVLAGIPAMVVGAVAGGALAGALGNDSDPAATTENHTVPTVVDSAPAADEPAPVVLNAIPAPLNDPVQAAIAQADSAVQDVVTTAQQALAQLPIPPIPAEFFAAIPHG